MRDSIADVIVDVGTRHLTGVFSYRIVPELVEKVQLGHRVFVPFGRQSCQGFVVGLREEGAGDLKPLDTLLDEEPLLTPELLALCRFLEDRTLCSAMEAVKTMLPGAFAVSTKHLYQALPGQHGVAPGSQGLYQALSTRRSLPEIIRKFGPDATLLLEGLLATGAVAEVAAAAERTGSKQQAVLVKAASDQDMAHAITARQSRAPKQARILAALFQRDRLPAHELGVTPSDPAVAALIRDGLITIASEEIYRSPVRTGLVEPASERPELTPLQQTALSAIQSALGNGQPAQVVLHGVTGSGKTEVYMQAIEHVLHEGCGAIVLVPEIVLTPQLVGRFAARFGERVALLHSGLSNGERRDEWLRLRRGEATVVVGARSAVFAPVHRLKLIIIDEEHESSYKQEEAPYYDARDVAGFRADHEGAVVIRGSATPSMEAIHLAATGQARLVTMPVRVHARPLPPVEVVDMREELKAGNRSIFSHALMDGLKEAVTSGRQAVLFLNRRGYAAFMLCRACGEVVQCPNCDISLTLHQVHDRRTLECHYCGYRAPATGTCPACHEDAERPFGVGTEQVEALLQEQWPQWRVLRMDVGTTRKKGAHQAALQTFLDGDADILLGTQMIAKGLDFPNVAFVGVIAADTMLSVPDYRSAERTFSLLTQVAGRSGRGDVPGRTVIQTFRPDHYAIAAAAHHDFTTFYRQEDEMRRLFAYPPYCELAVFRAVHREERYARGAAERFERELRRALPADLATVLPAAPAGIRRIENQHRYQVVVKYSKWDAVKQPVGKAYQVVLSKMRSLKGTCLLDVHAGRI